MTNQEKIAKLIKCQELLTEVDCLQQEVCTANCHDYFLTLENLQEDIQDDIDALQSAV
jgi:hypothetical protein